MTFGLRIAFSAFLLLLTVHVVHHEAFSQKAGSRFEWVSPEFSLEPFSRPRRIGSGTVEVYSPNHILRSTDKGVTWSRQAGEPWLDTLRMQANWIDDLHGWGISYGPIFYISDMLMHRTDDGGATWKSTALPMHARQLSVASWTHGFILDNVGKLFATTDGGTSWNEITVENGLGIRSIWSISPELTFLSGMRSGEPDSNVVLRTTGGAWHRVDLIPDSATVPGGVEFSGISFADNQSGIAYGPGNRIFLTSDAGATWMPVVPDIAQAKGDPAIISELRLIHMGTRNRGWALGYFDEIFTTQDGGRTWSVQDTGTPPVYTYATGVPTLVMAPVLGNIVSIDENHVVMTGHQGNLVTTSDAGATWTSRNRAVTNEYLTSVAFATPDAGWIAGIKGGIFRTTNGGASWERQNAGDTTWITDLQAIDQQTAWAAGAKGVFRTTDGGSNWQFVRLEGFPVDSVTYQDIRFFTGIRAISMVDRDHGWAAGIRGTVFRTTDGGQSWSPCAPLPGEPFLNGVSFVDATTGWVTGSEASVFRTTDGGLSWERQITGDTIPAQTANLLSFDGISFLDRNHGVVVGSRGRIFFTSDGGATWARGTGAGTTRDYVYATAAYLSADELWCGGSFQGSFLPMGIVSSSQNGNIWSDPSFVFPASVGPVNDISFPDRNHGYFVGKDGAVLRYVAPGSSSVTMLETDAVNDGIQIYPNPASSYLHIELLTQSTATARIFDVHGMEISRTLSSMEGSVLTIDMQYQPAGMYFARIIIDGKAVTKAFVLR